MDLDTGSVVTAKMDAADQGEPCRIQSIADNHQMAFSSS